MDSRLKDCGNDSREGGGNSLPREDYKMDSRLKDCGNDSREGGGRED